MLTQLPELFIEAFRVSTEQRKVGAFWWDMSSDGVGWGLNTFLYPDLPLSLRVQILVACGAGAGLAAVRQGNAGDWSCFCCEGAQVVCKGCTWEEFALIVHANKTRHMVFN